MRRTVCTPCGLLRFLDIRDDLGVAVLAGGDRLRVGGVGLALLDDRHLDLVRLAELEFEGQAVEIRWAPFIQFPRLLRSGEVDATVWNVDQAETYLSPGVALRPLSERVMTRAGAKSISATFVGRRGRHTVRAVLQTAIDPARVMEIQRKIISGEMIPEY